jgi:hypothetical protein
MRAALQGDRLPEGSCAWRQSRGVPARSVGRARGSQGAEQAASPTGREAVRVWGRRDGMRVMRHKLHSTLAQSIAGRIGGR